MEWLLRGCCRGLFGGWGCRINFKNPFTLSGIGVLKGLLQFSFKNTLKGNEITPEQVVFV